MKTYSSAIAIVIATSAGLGCKGGDQSSAVGPNGMSADSSGAIHDNRGNTYTAPPSGVAEKDFPVPYYPDSKPDGDTSATTMANGKRNLIATRITTDPVGKVVDFYKGKLPGMTTTGGGDHIMLGAKFPNGDEVSIPINKEDRGTTIGISATVHG